MFAPLPHLALRIWRRIATRDERLQITLANHGPAAYFGSAQLPLCQPCVNGPLAYAAKERGCAFNRVQLLCNHAAPLLLQENVSDSTCVQTNTRDTIYILRQAQDTLYVTDANHTSCNR